MYVLRGEDTGVELCDNVAIVFLALCSAAAKAWWLTVL